ncbi:protein-disulfide reductase DsbD domain-containing protein [Pinibacter aurantiacus]|uniref:Protein-disulfide reductase DsbD N-terminal domain-containing protein n=1 Tax=Pinibacter aurantiacus TaxID=2851599 RepID=A0A9E2SGP5_9BACT|nr:protein-disulfide reductase DsbD domain-containing protein [Pinibacter aurantiacus]MBV4360400.1 protein-disulfide reductase DsbD N-terminal domain-containing protein [Pinibacter aurantiacus]
MLKLVTTLLMVIVTLTVFGQAEEPAQWTFSAKKVNDTIFEIHLSAKLEEGWHIYSQSTPEGGPVATSVSFSKNPQLMLKGDIIEEGKLEKNFETMFGVEVFRFSKKVDFVQTVLIKPNAKANASGSITYMTCDDEQCIPPKTVEFSVPVK